MLVLSGISLLAFLSTLVFTKKNRTLGDTILSCWFLVLLIHLTCYHLANNGSIEKYSFLAGWELPLPLLHGPLLFLYVSDLVKKHKKVKIPSWVHFLPFLVIFIYLFDFYGLPRAQKINILRNGGQGFEEFILLKHILNIVSGLGYILWSLVLINSYKKASQKPNSTLPYINLKWLELLAWGLAAIWGAVVLTDENLIFATVSVYSILISFFGIKVVEIHKDVPRHERKKDGLNIFKNKTNDISNLKSTLEIFSRYTTSGLNKEKTQLIKSKLDEFSNKEKAYQDANLTLNGLAGKIGVHPNYLSQYINENLELSFHDYVNTLRVEEFKKRVHSNEHKKYNLLALAYDCGFNSKSSFNRNFKKVTGLTPSQAINSLNT